MSPELWAQSDRRDMAAILCIIPGPSERTVTERTAEKWCFACKRRGLHTLVMLSDPFPSYYEPVGIWECPKCGKDRTGFGDGF